ncbi:hypothetical protein H1C71_027612 [Ictidomys tridecemlineatus]|nr:hypothetical protein H1C71_027612 [Ictidomys tridecemlineatus]KAG3257862.1 hypothetical protein H1C71_027612 [Ictidomys tridecemlineatus]KAG3257863.1 hypothetical protein H1C71_027612 [Ictidomys tridecemlineatus]KAG3257864.1 hypothetical protein H1C71_027612 [Ictidomys tridecemlineatus]
MSLGNTVELPQRRAGHPSLLLMVPLSYQDTQTRIRVQDLLCFLQDMCVEALILIASKGLTSCTEAFSEDGRRLAHGLQSQSRLQQEVGRVVNDSGVSARGCRTPSPSPGCGVMPGCLTLDVLGQGCTPGVSH